MSDAAARFWVLDRFGAAAGGRWHGGGEGVQGVLARGVSIDTRTLERGEVYIAIRGSRFDGHAFVDDAVARGAPAVVVDGRFVGDAGPEWSAAGGREVGILVVDDTRAALRRLASAYRDALDATIIGVTGSNGKTSTVRLIAAALRGRGAGDRGGSGGSGGGGGVWSSVKSYNNEIGVPLTLLGAPADCSYVVCELGMNSAGEIALLGAMVRPDVGVVTNVGRAHVGRLGSVSAIAREKLSLLRFVGDFALVPTAGAEPGVVDMALDELREAGVFGGHGGGIDVVRVRRGAGAGGGVGLGWELVDQGTGWVRFRVSGSEAVFRVGMGGVFSAQNGAIAVGVARRLGFGDDWIAAGLASCGAVGGRLEVRRRGGVVVLDDCYNASPESMLAALGEFVRMAGEEAVGGDGVNEAGGEGGCGVVRRLVVLGEMGELGAHSEVAHRELGRAIVSGGVVGDGDGVVLVGDAMRWVMGEALGGCEGLGATVEHVDDAVAAVALVRERVDGGRWVVLVKGSRSVGLEVVVDAALSCGG